MITNNEIEALAQRLAKLDAYGCCREASVMLLALKEERSAVNVATVREVEDDLREWGEAGDKQLLARADRLKEALNAAPLVPTETGVKKGEIVAFGARMGKGTAFLHFIELMAHDALMWRTLMEHSKADHIWHYVLSPEHHKLGKSVNEVLLALADGKGNG